MRLIVGDCLEILPGLEAESVQCVVTSPPYWGLRDYGVAGQMGLEATPDEYVAKMVAVFREVRRVLRDDGTLWLNLGDSFNGKQLVGMPWRLAFALQADGWYLRSDIIWAKPNPMPESVTDRPTKSHEYVFLLSKSARYYYDQEAISEPTDGRSWHDVTGPPRVGVPGQTKQDGHGRRHAGFNGRYFSGPPPSTRNARSVWAIATQPFPGAHFATFPEALARRCVLAGCPEGGVVLDPFAGSGTVGVVCKATGRDFLGIELSPKYVAMAERRIAKAPSQQLQLRSCASVVAG